MKKIFVKNTNEWRTWLAKNHNKEKAIWLVFYKKNLSIPSIDYDSAVEQALCYGWIDSIIRKINDSQYARKFTPRNKKSKWSQSNIKRAKKMIDLQFMTKYGLAKIDNAKQNGTWDNPVSANKKFDMPDEFISALGNDVEAQSNFNELAPSYKNQYLGWIATAKKTETRARRIKESIQLLRNGQKLGLR
ncbi:YdeI family protein [Candidatus Neomarinimicrobiota bacterium]